MQAGAFDCRRVRRFEGYLGGRLEGILVGL